MADSVCEAEYVATSDASKGDCLVEKFIIELRVVFSFDGSIYYIVIVLEP